MSKIPFEFVLEILARVNPLTRSMFGCYGVYVGEKIVLALRNRTNHEDDNGVWVATVREHHEDLRKDFPSLRSIRLFGTRDSGWQVLPAIAADFEESVIRVCEMILRNDPRIGKSPKARTARKIRKR